MAPSVEGFSAKKGVRRDHFNRIERVRGAPPGTKNQSGPVESGL